MRKIECQCEAEVLEALRSGAWEPELRQHVQECAVCSELLVVAEFLQSEAAIPASEPALPDAGMMWWRAQLAARRAAVKRATWPIRLFGKLAWLGGVFLGLWSLLGSGSTLTSQLSQQPWWSSPAGVAALVCGAVALLSLFLGSAYLVWAEK
jgi:hypothetical protein